MSFRDLFSETLRTLWAHKLRTCLTLFGIAWGVVSITLMVAAGEGLRAGQQKVTEGFGKNIMIIHGGRTALQAGGSRAGRQIRWTAADHELVRAEATDCRHIVPELGHDRMPVRSSFNHGAIRVVAALPAFAEVRSIPVGSGRFYNQEDVEQARRVAFLGSDVKKQLFGGRDPHGQTVSIRGTPYAVIGVMRAKDQDSSYDGRDVTKIFIPFTAMLRDFPKTPPARPDEIDRLIVTPKSLDVHESCKAQVRRVLGRIHGFDPRDKEAAGIWDTIQNAKSFQAMTDGMKHFLGAMGVATLFLGGLGVMNVMLVAVRERTREIGVRKAVGATSRAIVRQFFMETLFIVFLSGGIGMAAAYGVCFAVNQMPMPPFFAGLLPTWETAALTIGLLGTVAVLSAVYPARRAAAIDPIEALRFEPGG